MRSRLLCKDSGDFGDQGLLWHGVELPVDPTGLFERTAKIFPELSLDSAEADELAIGALVEDRRDHD